MSQIGYEVSEDLDRKIVPFNTGFRHYQIELPDGHTRVKRLLYKPETVIIPIHVGEIYGVGEWMGSHQMAEWFVQEMFPPWWKSAFNVIRQSMRKLFRMRIIHESRPWWVESHDNHSNGPPIDAILISDIEDLGAEVARVKKATL